MPIVTIQSPSGRSFQIDAPEGATDDQILRFAKSQGLFDQQPPSAQPTDQLRPEQSATPPDVDFIPTEENLSRQRPEKEERTTGETLAGIGEAALATLTGATGGALGFVAGAVPGVINELLGDGETGDALKEAQEFASSLTFEPRTEAGKEFVGDIGDALGVLPPILGATPVSTLRTLVPGKAITEKLLANPRAKRSILSEEIRRGNPNIETVTQALDSDGNLFTRPASKRAIKVLGGDNVAKGTVSVLENMSQASKSQVNKMLSNIERGRREPLFGDANRPSDILGQSVLNRAEAVSAINKRAGKEIGSVAQSLKDVNVDTGAVNNKFFNQLSELGVTFSKADDGWVTPDFSRSKFVGGSQKDMTVLVNDLINTKPGFEAAHKLKQSIRDNVNFDKGGTGQLSRNSEQILKELSSGIDDVLDTTSPAYKKANESFSKTIKVKEDFDKLAGKDIDIASDLSAEILGAKAMRLDSNAVSRTAIKQLFLNTEDVLSDFKVRFKDDIPSLIHITSKLNDAFKLAPSGSLKGNIISGGLDVAEAVTSPAAAARIAARKLSQIKDPDFNKKIRAFRSITGDKK